MLRRSCIHLTVECVAIVHQADIPVWVLWQLGRDASHVSEDLEYPRGVRMIIDQGIWMASLEC